MATFIDVTHLKSCGRITNSFLEMRSAGFILVLPRTDSTVLTVLESYWKCSFPMKPHVLSVCWLIGWLGGLSVIIALACSNRSTCLLIIYSRNGYQVIQSIRLYQSIFEYNLSLYIIAKVYLLIC